MHLISVGILINNTKVVQVKLIDLKWLLRKTVIQFYQSLSCGGELSEIFYPRQSNMLCHLPFPLSAVWVTGGGCGCTVVLTGLALSLVFVSKSLWETGSQASEWTQQTFNHTYKLRAGQHRVTPAFWLLWAICGLDSITKPFWFCLV